MILLEPVKVVTDLWRLLGVLIRLAAIGVVGVLVIAACIAVLLFLFTSRDDR